MDGLIGGPEKKRMSSRKKQVLAYSIVLAVCYAAFWLFAGGMGAMGYSFLVQLFTLPLANFIIALFMGLDKSWKERQWWLLLYFGFGFFLMQYGTFSLANMLSKGSLNLPEWGLFSTGMALALPGMALGSVIRWGRELTARPEGLRRAWLVYGLVWGISALLPYLIALLVMALTIFMFVPEIAFQILERGLQVLFLAGPCGIAQLAAAVMGFFLGKSPDWTRQVKYLPVFGAASFLGVGVGISFLPWELSPQVAAVLMLASFLGGMVPPLVGLGLARGRWQAVSGRGYVSDGNFLLTML